MTTIPVWVSEHDDPEVQYVVNEREDMLENWEDLVDAGINGERSFEEYLATWVSLDMPQAVFSADYPERNAWLAEALGVADLNH